MNKEEKLKSTQAGDWAFVYLLKYSSNKLEKVQVTKITDTQILCGEKRYNRETGREIRSKTGRFDSRDYLYPYSDRDEKRWQRQEALDYLALYKFHVLSTQNLIEIVKMLKSMEKAQQ